MAVGLDVKMTITFQVNECMTHYSQNLAQTLFLIGIFVLYFCIFVFYFWKHQTTNDNVCLFLFWIFTEH